MFFQTYFADLCIGIESNYETTKKFCAAYVKNPNVAETEQREEAEADFSVSASFEEIKAEDDQLSGVHYSTNYLETLAILRKIAERLPFYQRFLMHGATISFEGKAYMFTAVSGTGKSTHIKLWKRFLGDKVQIVNGDKPFLQVNDEVRIYGSPWAGKENWHRNTSAPLAGLCFLKRGKENRIRKMKPQECLSLLMKQVYLPKEGLAAGMTLELLDKMLKIVPLYLLECDMSEEAVQTSFSAMTGLNYQDYRVETECEEKFYAD